MPSDVLTFRVTRTDIKQGVPTDETKSPIAIAARRAFIGTHFEGLAITVQGYHFYIEQFNHIQPQDPAAFPNDRPLHQAVLNDQVFNWLSHYQQSLQLSGQDQVAFLNEMPPLLLRLNLQDHTLVNIDQLEPKQLFFPCPSCAEPFAQVDDQDVDIYAGETYQCSHCGASVVLMAFSMEMLAQPTRIAWSYRFCGKYPSRKPFIRKDEQP